MSKHSNILEIGISDHLNLIVITLKSEFIKGNPKIRRYRDYKDFVIEYSNEIYINLLKQTQITDYSFFQNISTEVLNNKHLPLKTKILRFVNNPRKNEKLRKSMIRLLKLKKYLLRRKKKATFLYKYEKNKKEIF